MSRTYRRFDRPILPDNWIYRDWETYSSPYWETTYHDPKSKAGKIALARYRCDVGCGDRSNAPPDFRRFYHKSDRQKGRMKIHHWMKGEIEEVILNANHRHNATWDWN